MYIFYIHFYRNGYPSDAGCSDPAFHSYWKIFLIHNTYSTLFSCTSQNSSIIRERGSLYETYSYEEILRFFIVRCCLFSRCSSCVRRLGIYQQTSEKVQECCRILYRQRYLLFHRQSEMDQDQDILILHLQSKEKCQILPAFILSDRLLAVQQ